MRNPHSTEYTEKCSKSRISFTSLCSSFSKTSNVLFRERRRLFLHCKLLQNAGLDSRVSGLDGDIVESSKSNPNSTANFVWFLSLVLCQPSQLICPLAVQSHSQTLSTLLNNKFIGNNTTVL